MKNKENEKYYKWGLTGVIVAAIAIVIANIVFNHNGEIGALTMLAKILRPFLIGGAIAYLVTPMAKFFTRLFGGKCEGLANALALIVAIAIVLAVILLIVPQLVSSIIKIAQNAPAQLQALQANLQTFIKNYTAAHPDHAEFVNSTVDKVTSWIDNFTKTNLSNPEALLSKLGPILTGSASKVTSAFGAIKDLLIGAIVALYFLSRRTQLAEQAKMVVRSVFKPAWSEWILNEVKYADKMFNGFFIGKLVDSAIIGVICFVGCLLMRFENPLLIAVIVGVTNIIPFFGPLIGAIPCLLLLLLENPMHALMFLVFIIVLQQLDGNVIGPKILGDSTGLSALWVMFGILLFGGLWGILGMLVGVPLTAVLYDIVRQLTFNAMRARGYGAEVDAYNKRFHPEVTPKQKKAKAK